jgi:signal transduction histidine kinase/DNA-binding response OmpR family regulator
MKLKIVSLVFLFLVTNFAQAQVKFRVKKLNADSLVALIPEKEGTELVEALNILSNVICRKNIDSSLILASQAIELSKTLEYQKGLADGYFNTGNVFFLLDSLQPTISNYLKALRIYEDLEPSVEYGNLCMQINMINYYTGRSKGKGVKNYSRQALHIYERINDKTGQAIAYFSIGTKKYLFIKEYDSANYYLNKALIFLDPATDQNEVAYNYQQIAIAYKHCYQKFRDTTCFTNALSYFFKALKMPEIYDDTKASIYLNLGLAYFYSDVEKSETNGILYLNKAKNIYDTCLDGYKFNFIIMGHFGLASYWKGDYDKAIFYFKQGIDIIEERLSTFSIEEFREPIFAYNVKYYLKLNKQIIYEHLYNTYIKLDDYKTAHEYYTLSKEAEEEIYKEKNQNLITMLESVSEDEKTEKQMSLLARDNELKALTIKQSRTYLFALAGFILVLVLVALLYFRQRKIRAEHKIFVREQKLLHDLELKNMESEKLKELDHLKSRFFANISHEFRTPLTLIKGPLEKVLSNIEDIQKNKKELVIAKKYAGKLQILINNLLTISKLESGKMKLHVSETDVAKLVGTYIQSFESLAKQKNISLHFKAKEEEIIVYIDREKFEQVLNNLLSNAFKFTGEGGKVEVEVTPLSPPSRGDNSMSQIDPSDSYSNAPSPLQAGTRWVEIKISDTGHGIPPEHINHIFDRFYQAGQENNSYYEGTGIGLALTKELVELHNGTIKVDSLQGKGSTFTILLPLGKEHPKPEEIVVEKTNEIISPAFSQVLQESQEESAAVIDNATETENNQSILLIVEDNADMRSYIRGYFENEFHIIEAIDGADGYEKSTEHIPDIIISDVMMPNMDGVEFCKKVKTDERTSHIPVILLTARASKESRMEGLETGADDFITKPFDGDELQVRVNNLIKQRKRLSTTLERKFQKSYSTIDLDFEDMGITSMDDKFLQKAKEVADKNLSNSDYTIEDFASAMALSRSQLHRKLKALINSSGTEFINTIKMNYAIELLQKKAGTISEIAYDAGFNNPNYFSKIFRRKFGMSPSEYQNNIG